MPEVTVRAELADNGKHVIVMFPYDALAVMKIRDIPTRKWMPVDSGKMAPGYNRLAADFHIMKRLREEFGSQLKIGPKLKAWGWEQRNKKTTLRTVSAADDAVLKNVPNDLEWGVSFTGEPKKLAPYQRADISYMAKHSVINANQPGSGKTAEIILSLAEAELLHGFHLVNAPLKSLRFVWEKEIEEIYEALGEEAPTILTGDTPDERRAAIREAKELFEEGYAFWLLLNPAFIRKMNVQVLNGKQLEIPMRDLDGFDQMQVQTEEMLNSPLLLDIDWTSFTIDEFHLMGLTNPQTQGHKGCKQLAKATKPARMYVASGTPIQGKPIKLWGALHFLYPENFTSKWNWADLWLDVDKEATHGAKIGGIMPGREEEFYDEHAQYLIRRTTADSLPGLPEKQRLAVWCDMTPKQAEQYRTFAAEAEWRLDDTENTTRITATNILAEYTRLKQFADAYCEVVGGELELEIRQTQQSGKLELLEMKLADEGVLDKEIRSPALIFSQFNGMVEMVTEWLNDQDIKAAFINGKVKPKEALMLAEHFQNNLALDVLLLNTYAGTALTLSRAESVHILDETWTPDDQEQAEDRAFGGHRAVGKEDGRIYYYRTKDTIEEMIQDVVKGKALNNHTVLDLRKKVHKAVEAVA